MSKSRVKGTSGENEVVTLFKRWWKSCERRALHGVRDRGDVAGTPFVVSVKRAENWHVMKWLKELEVMRDNEARHHASLHTPDGFILARRNREDWVALVPQDTFVHLLDAAYGGRDE